MKQLRNCRALITGAGSGIGLAIARRLSGEGVRVVLVDRRRDRLDEANERYFDGEARVQCCDIAHCEGVERLTEDVIADGPIQILINAAGISHAGTFLASSLDDYRHLFEVNFWGTLYMIAATLPHLLQQNEAHIVNIVSSFAWVGFPGKGAYAASKFAVRGFSESLREELRGTSVNLTLLYPGPVATNLVRDGMAVDPKQREMEEKFLALRGISADRVAERTLRGIRKNTPRIVVGRDYRCIDLLLRLLPNRGPRLIARAAHGWITGQDGP